MTSAARKQEQHQYNLWNIQEASDERASKSRRKKIARSRENSSMCSAPKPGEQRLNGITI
jgi:hypothetical protein